MVLHFNPEMVEGHCFVCQLRGSAWCDKCLTLFSEEAPPSRWISGESPCDPEFKDIWENGPKKMKQIVLSKKQKRILISIVVNGEQTREELEEDTGIPRTTLHDNLKQFEKWKILMRYKKGNGKVGRSKVYWDVVNKSGGDDYDL